MEELSGLAGWPALEDVSLVIVHGGRIHSDDLEPREVERPKPGEEVLVLQLGRLEELRGVSSESFVVGEEVAAV